MTGIGIELERMLLSARKTGNLAAVPAGDVTLDEAYAIQRALHDRSQLPIMVWKIGLTADGPRRAKGANEPIVGRLPASAIFSDRSEVSFAGNEMYAEAELVFELDADLPPRGTPYGRDDVVGAIRSLYAGIELVATRFAHSELPLGLLVADNAMAHGLLLGRKLAAGWEDRFADLPASLARNDEAPIEGSTARAMGNPLDALVWLANWLCENGEGGLRREQLVASGTCTGITEIFPGDRLAVTFDHADSARVSLSA
ncbi:MAG: hypothetical protein KKD64_06800 [Alphaproteobacteria bacterium]|nr:hypothetical protein [Alphaproteobacteria bacterium]MBU0794985.1 hypothetical protein [Alphaproteobacteria bacterium]MBU0876643.1 hypothetical protein [Alphaproteobacteria bacterium]MBU1769345.1 hypothetical protein [Alphaproteobacteria bacterium]